ncbi:MAG TPA: GGDEF domain-containing protein [Thermosulfurimonas dismutans]|uniref:GGDEF domain-containing protein n=1 Tax=Thermosulfurimonas dismutans TaxID=999894 RepID=A0A7C3GKK4_9BACT|nr:GGDEF domain-containing protein [Thermosulfurimonas dismutans]
MPEDQVFLKKRLAECEEELARTRELLLIDPITGFFNERGFLRALNAEMSRCLREGYFLALTLLEIQGLEAVEGVFGVFGVQKILSFLAEHLKKHLRVYDLLGTTSRNIFWIATPIKRTGEGARIAQRIQELVEDLVYDDGKLTFPVRTTLITRVLCGGSPSAELLHQTLKLLPKARLAREPLVILGSESPEQKSLEQKIFRAIVRGELAVALQPAVNIRTGKVVFHEVLARFISEEGTVSAGTFLPSVEGLGLFEDLDRQILYKALVLLRNTPEIGRVAVNISPEYVLGNLAQDLLSWIRELDLYPQDVILEIHPKSTVPPLSLFPKLHFLKGEGFSLSLDKFGNEGVYLSFLRDIPWDMVKVDGGCIRGLITNEFDRRVLGFLSDCALLQGFKLVAEQVEEERILRELTRYGISYAQGFHCGEPELIPETRYVKPPGPTGHHRRG